MVKKIILGSLLVFPVLFLITRTIFADVLPDIPFNSPCKNGTTPVFCEKTMKDYSSPSLRNGCTKYENNKDFESFSYSKNIKNGRIIITEQYCPTSSNAHINSPLKVISNDLLALVFTLFIEGLVLLFFRYFSNLRALMGFLLANILSYTGFLLVLRYVISPLNYYLWIILLEALIVIFEIVLVKIITKEIYRRIVIPFIVANFISATIGTLIFKSLMLLF